MKIGAAAECTDCDITQDWVKGKVEVGRADNTGTDKE
jgi:hypothetical protein